MLEAGFLVLLAVVVGFADLDPALIVLVMTVGWLLVSLIEYFAWRQLQAVALRHFEPAAAPARVVREEVVEEVAPPPPPPPPTPVEEETIVTPPAAETVPAEAEAPEGERTEFHPEPERRIAHRLEPLRPRPRRKWILFGPYERRSEPAPEGDREEER